MEITFSKKEYRLLIDMLYLADWVMHSYLTNHDDDNDYKMLRKKILSHYKEMGAEDILEYSKKYDEYFETREHEDKMLTDFVVPYEDEVFWDELASRLAHRDIIKQLGLEKYKSLERIDRATKTVKIISKYNGEFERNGLENVKIDPVKIK